MKLINLEEKEFKKYALEHPLNNFHQTIEWGLLKEQNGWKMNLLGLVDKKEIKAACMLLRKKTPFGNVFYSPRGFLIDYNDKDLLKTFTDEIKEYGRKNNAIFIKIDPYVSYKERDIDGNIVKDGFNNEEVVNNLIILGYKHHGFNLYFEDLQPRWIFTLNLENKTLDEILQGMESKTRQLINKNIRMRIVTRELIDSDLKEFKNIMAHTSERRGFIDRPFSYYKNMYDILSKSNMIKFMVTELHTNEYIDILKKDIEEEENGIREKEDRIKENSKVNIERTKKQIEVSKENIKRLNKKLEEITELKDKHGDVIVLGGILFITYGDEVLSLFGGSYKEFMDYYSPYTTNYEMIKYAKENGYNRYNFYGITGDFNKDNEFYGLYDFKRGFGGEVTELIGEFDLVISKPKMIIYNFSIKAYSLLKKIKSKIMKG
jgi:lipid II:glycine glycyltransferase (peptidoglycan interpeptide bridge formation enzyme)